MKSAHERGRPVTGLGPKRAESERRLSSEGHRNFEMGASLTPAGRHDRANQGQVRRTVRAIRKKLFFGFPGKTENRKVKSEK